MVNSIVSLDSKRKKHVKVYDHTKEYVDQNTGEVSRTVHSFTRETTTKDDFVKLYVENINFLQVLTNSEIKILLYAIKRIDYSNSFSFSPNFIGYFVENKILSKSAIYRSFKSLVDKRIFLEATKELKQEYELYGDNIYFIHPDIASKGSFLQLKELKRTIVQTFNFNSLTMEQELITESKYDEFDNIKSNSKDYEIKSISYNKKDEEEETEFVIAEKNNIIDVEAQNFKEASLFDEPTTDFPPNNVLISSKKDGVKIEILKLEFEKSQLDLEKANLNKLKDELSQVDFDYKMAEINMKEVKIKLDLELLKNKDNEE